MLAREPWRWVLALQLLLGVWALWSLHTWALIAFGLVGLLIVLATVWGVLHELRRIRKERLGQWP